MAELKFTEEQEKQILAENLSKLVWWNEYSTEGFHLIKAPLDFPCTPNGQVAEGLKKFGLENIHTVTSEQGMQARENMLMDKGGKPKEFVVIAAGDNQDNWGIAIHGVSNLKALADAGVKFPGASLYKSQEQKKWSEGFGIS